MIFMIIIFFFPGKLTYLVQMLFMVVAPDEADNVDIVDAKVAEKKLSVDAR